MTGFAGQDLAGQRGEQTIFVDLTFGLRRGGALMLIGPNGSGKTTLLRCMAGLSRPVAGTLSWDGVPIEEDSVAHRRRLHLVGHQDAMKPSLTATENLLFWSAMRATRRRGPVGRSAVLRALGTFGIESLANIPVRLLSAGQRRRLALARLLVSPAPLWLLDEPTSSLDDVAIDAFEQAVSSHRESGGMVVMASHGGPAPPGAFRLMMLNYRPGVTRTTVPLAPRLMVGTAAQ